MAGFWKKINLLGEMKGQMLGAKTKEELGLASEKYLKTQTEILRGNGKINSDDAIKDAMGIGHNIMEILTTAAGYSRNYEKNQGLTAAAGSLASPVELLGRAFGSEKTIGQAAKDTFLDEKGELMLGKAAGGVIGGMMVARGTLGAARGAFTDDQGHVDLPGIPFF